MILPARPFLHLRDALPREANSAVQIEIHQLFPRIVAGLPIVIEISSTKIIDQNVYAAVHLQGFAHDPARCIWGAAILLNRQDFSRKILCQVHRVSQVLLTSGGAHRVGALARELQTDRTTDTEARTGNDSRLSSDS